MFKHPCPDCIGIPLTNAYGEIMALQMRNMNPKSVRNGMKYFYVSSRNVSNEKTKGKVRGLGSSPGSPVHVFYPKRRRSNTFYIGEGFFKMNEVCKDGFTALSIQGVNTFHYVADEVGEIIKRDPSYNASTKLRMMIVFDMDLYEKIQVLDAGLNFAGYLKKKFPDSETYFLFWSEELGKGYDDLKFNCINQGANYLKMLKAYRSDQIQDFVKESEKIVAQTFHVPVKIVHEGMRNGACMIGLTKAANTFDKGRFVKFSSYAYTCMENECKTLAKKVSNSRKYLEKPIYSGDLSYSSYVDSDNNEEDSILNRIEDEKIAEQFKRAEVLSFLDSAINSLVERKQGIIRDYFGLNEEGVNMTQVEVAVKYGFSQPRIKSLISESIEELKLYFNKKGIYDFSSIFPL